MKDEHNHFKVKILADSYCEQEQINGEIASSRVTSFELEYYRYIHCEMLTHRVASRNAASSRAIPVIKKIKQVWNDPALAVFWGVNRKGMQAVEEMSGFRLKAAKFTWRLASKFACIFAYTLQKLGLHKQLTNRLLEPFEIYKVVFTATEFENFFKLRDHPDAQPEFQVLARAMRKALDNSEPMKIFPGEYHLPYIDRVRNDDGTLSYYSEGVEVSLDDAIMISISCAAQASYRLLDMTLNKAKSIYKKLILSAPSHDSPREHQCTPMKSMKFDMFEGLTWQDGVTHMSRDGYKWSGNLRGFIQCRHGYTPDVENILSVED